MGFYGNITNTTRTQFQFDKIYPNRYTMDKNIHTDGIYIGRYVLVEYDLDYNVIDNFILAYDYDSSNKTLLWEQKNEDGDVEKVVITKGKLGTFNFDGLTITPIVYSNIGGKIVFYKAITERDFDGSEEPAKFDEEIILDEKSSNYGENFTIDKLTYGVDRGYDSTVWMKSYIDGKEKYIMIAELNTVVPTFEVYPDAPRLKPVAPHFDKNSTNVYYPLHWLTTWGFRVKPTDDIDIPSDETINDSSGLRDEKGYNGAIYYNKAGFDYQTRRVVDTDNYISIEPTGESGEKYIDHSNEDKATINSEMISQPDILELSIMLPALGNSVAKMWDIVYGYDENNKRYTDIEYKYPSNGVMSTENKTFDLNTLAGCINKYHKVLGLNIFKTTREALEDKKTEDWYNKHYIYETNKGYYRIHKEILYTTEEGATLGQESGVAYLIVEILGLEEEITTIYRLILDIKLLLGTDVEINETADKTTVQGCINTLNKIIDLYNKKYNDDSLIVFTDKKFTSADFNGDSWIDCSIIGNDVSIKHKERSSDNTYTSLGEPSIDLDKAELTVYTPCYDNAGHIVMEEKLLLPLPKAYSTFKTQGSSDIESNLDMPETNEGQSGVIAASSQDILNINPANTWIRLKTSNVDNANEDILYIAHSLINNQLEGETTEDGDKTPKFGELFNVPIMKYDKAGHIIDTSTYTVTIPLPSLNDLAVTTSSVITGLSLDATEGKLTQTNNNVGSLALTGYGNENTATAIAATDTINEAIRKLENLISNEVQNRTDNVGTLTDTVKDNYDNLNNAITTEVSNRNEAIATAINALDVDEISTDNSYISSIKLIDGKISANTMALPDYSSYWDRIDTLEETVALLTTDLGTANDTITTLQKDLADLLATVELLSAKINEYHPTEEDNAVEE